MTRMISFRVSEDEFEQLRSKSEANGARSISDYARLALCGATNGTDGHLESDIHELSDGIQQLNHHIRRLAELMENPDRSAKGGHHSMSANHNGGAD
jgi:hypothetical protein